MIFAIFWLSVLLFVAGVAVGVWYLVSRPPEGGAMRVLDERLARGEIGVDEHRERADALTPQRRRNPAGPLAVALIVAGIAGLAGSVVAAGTLGMDGMRRMMGGEHGSGMMDGMGGMMGRRGGSAPSPVPGAGAQDVVATEYAFSPDEIRVRARETVNLELDNQGDIFHTLTISDLGFELSASGGESEEGSLEVDDPGTYRFVCTVPGHAEAGMVGTLVVTEAS